MSTKKAAWAEWLAVFGSSLGLPGPESCTEASLRHYYRQLCLLVHPDRLAASDDDQRTKDLKECIFKDLSDVYDKYEDPEKELHPPQDEEPLDHDHGRPPKKSRATRRGREVYLVTFSHSEGEGRRSPSDFSRREFGELLIKAFEAAFPGLHVQYLAVFQEQHAPSPTEAERKVHFHASVKSDQQGQSL